MNSGREVILGRRIAGASIRASVHHGVDRRANGRSRASVIRHGLDPVPGAVYREPGEGRSAAPFGDRVSMWEKIGFNQYGPRIDVPRMQQINSPDNYDYLDFDFDSSAAGTIQTFTSYQ